MTQAIPRDPETGDRLLSCPELAILRVRVEQALYAVERGYPAPWVEFDPWAQLNPGPDTQERALTWVLDLIEEVGS